MFSRSISQPPAFFAAFAAALLLALAACGGGDANGRSRSPDRPLPAYTGHAAELFDDAIEPQAVGLEFETPLDPRIDPKFRERAQVSDAILRAKVDTVTARGDGAQARYDIAFRVVEKIAGMNPPHDEFTLHVEGDNPTAGILRTMQTQLGGKTFVAFVREFVRPDGDGEWHFHLSPDAKNVASAARDATALTQFSN